MINDQQIGSTLRALRVGLLLLACLTSSTTAKAATTEFVYEGRLATGGAPVTGPVTLRLSFFHSNTTGAQAVLDVTAGLESVPLVEGVFQVVLTMDNSDYAKVFSSVTQPVWVQVTDLTHTPSAPFPRQKLSTVPYAARVPVDGQTINFDANGNLALGLTTAPGANQFLTKDAGGNLVWAVPTGNSAQLQGQTVSSSTPTSGQVLLYNGSQWVPSPLGTTGSSVSTLTATPPLAVAGPATAPVLSETQATGPRDRPQPAGWHDYQRYAGLGHRSELAGQYDQQRYAGTHHRPELAGRHDHERHFGFSDGSEPTGRNDHQRHAERCATAEHRRHLCRLGRFDDDRRAQSAGQRFGGRFKPTGGR